MQDNNELSLVGALFSLAEIARIFDATSVLYTFLNANKIFLTTANIISTNHSFDETFGMLLLSTGEVECQNI